MILDDLQRKAHLMIRTPTAGIEHFDILCIVPFDTSDQKVIW